MDGEAAERCRLGFDASAVGGDDAFADGKAEPRATVGATARTLGAVQGFEQQRKFIRDYAR